MEEHEIKMHIHMYAKHHFGFGDTIYERDFKV